jgi:prepilin-type N-terminal cleavage/methylation domain-containing protein
MSYSKFFKNRGFTLVELIVVMTIAVILMTTFVVQQTSWNDRLTVNTQAFETVLMIRQAQTYSLGVKEYTAGTGDKFDVGYGIHFDSDHTRYIYFADANKNKKYDSGEAIETKTFTRGVTIDRVCGTNGSGVESCGSPLSQIDISFFRPEPKANMKFFNNGGSELNGGNELFAPATIYLRSTGNTQYKVSIQANGQVSFTPI